MATHHTTTQKIQHVHDWRVSGRTRLQYCRLHCLSSHAFHEWLRLPDDGVSVAEYSVLLPVCIQPSPDPAPVGGIITLHLPGGCRIDCLPAQLSDVLRAVRNADA
ncbi:IS66 family insertion sequence element accessory protein TnpA [Salmonella enterica]|uniref:IS66 family insertion sequence element accessory protein TnpA n=1 Tax=Salmonella enterica TaxID=28901 RepID=UPI00111BDBBE|nr:IS66 family insertion sequence element accessory protein TnpB [Salmonella enterica]HBC0155255.1 IS66 family insertion sequence element accessory protein TnpB [Salmonella enterica subsp. indica]HBC0167156.1 IS66 family insertion sequence element accessory protein TnpB [Salmonella enterica subsp. indica]